MPYTGKRERNILNSLSKNQCHFDVIEVLKLRFQFLLFLHKTCYSSSPVQGATFFVLAVNYFFRIVHIKFV